MNIFFLSHDDLLTQTAINGSVMTWIVVYYVADLTVILFKLNNNKVSIFLFQNAGQGQGYSCLSPPFISLSGMVTIKPIA